MVVRGREGSIGAGSDCLMSVDFPLGMRKVFSNLMMVTITQHSVVNVTNGKFYVLCIML